MKILFLFLISLTFSFATTDNLGLISQDRAFLDSLIGIAYAFIILWIVPK